MTRGDVDPNVMRRHLLALDDALNRLERYRGRSLGELEQTPDAIWAVERGLQLCAQNSLDIATHVAATAGRDVNDYTSSVDVLVKIGVLPADFAKRFRGIAGFRNVLVHAYLELDRELLVDLLNNRLDDFRFFAQRIQEHLDR